MFLKLHLLKLGSLPNKWLRDKKKDFHPDIYVIKLIPYMDFNDFSDTKSRVHCIHYEY